MAMGGSTGAGRGRRRGRGSQKGALSEINVTPMVDVMLVLLIIFMISAPLLTVGVPVDLPKTEAGAVNDEHPPLTLTIRRDGAAARHEGEEHVAGQVKRCVPSVYKRAVRRAEVGLARAQVEIEGRGGAQRRGREQAVDGRREGEDAEERVPARQRGAA